MGTSRWIVVRNMAGLLSYLGFRVSSIDLFVIEQYILNPEPCPQCPQTVASWDESLAGNQGFLFFGLVLIRISAFGSSLGGPHFVGNYRTEYLVSTLKPSAFEQGPRSFCLPIYPRPWVLPPLSNSWIIFLIWLYIALNRTPIIDCCWVGAVPNPNLNPNSCDGRSLRRQSTCVLQSRDFSKKNALSPRAWEYVAMPRG